MALAIPLEIPPEMGFTSRVFDIGHAQTLSPGGKGFLQTVQRATPMWFAEYKTAPLRADRYDAAIAFLSKLEGAMESFLAYDPRRPMPRAYQHLPTTADPWTATGEVAPRVIDSDYVTSALLLDRMEPGAIVSAGDYISFELGLKRYLYRVTTGYVANGGGFAHVFVKPRPFHVLVGTPEIRYRKAVAQMKIIGGYKEEDNVNTLPSFTFKASQFIDQSVEVEE
jgi:hypothetical protein